MKLLEKIFKKETKKEDLEIKKIKKILENAEETLKIAHIIQRKIEHNMKMEGLFANI